jgi:XTP/dITP diphosphohydrolase
MIRKIIFASFNKNKVKEVQGMLDLNDVILLSLSDFKNQKIPEAIENGDSFEENALIKARYYYNILKLPVISDDSGLEVPSLGNEPGIYSARYAGPDATDKKNNDLLLKKLENLPIEQRHARFIAILVYKDARMEKIFNGECHGVIAYAPKGQFGFGYDPLFFVPQLKKTYAELTIEEKSKISHRGMAVRSLKNFLEKA